MAVFAITIILAFFITGSYEETNSVRKNACTVQEHSISCLGVTGDFLSSLGDSPIYNVFIAESDISYLTAEDFAKYPEVTNIEIIDAYFSFPEQNQLFKSLNKLRNLTIQFCDIGEEVAGLYVTNESLEKLSLRGNRITSITRRLFPNHPHLRELDLSGNGATRMEEDILEHMKKLRLIDLRGNHLCGGSAGSVSVSHKHCEVCRPEDVSGRCSQADVTSCVAGLPFDRLWWRSPALEVKLQGNPLCDRVSTRPKNFEGEPYVGDWNCKVINKSCFSHERRKLFLMEACGMDLPFLEDDPEDSGDRSSPEYSEDADAREENTSKEKNYSQNNDIAEDGGYMFHAGLVLFTLYSLGCFLAGMGLGVMVTRMVARTIMPKDYDTVPTHSNDGVLNQQPGNEETTNAFTNEGSHPGASHSGSHGPSNQALPSENFSINSTMAYVNYQRQRANIDEQINNLRSLMENE